MMRSALSNMYAPLSPSYTIIRVAWTVFPRKDHEFWSIRASPRPPSPPRNMYPTGFKHSFKRESHE